ncbi:MAG TPA: PAS domain S-box protein [Egibacteraceae bacterium]|nr:PAS domain S-box protein [Egibacteraceae bacterium]
MRDAVVLPALTAHHLLLVAGRAAAERDRDRLVVQACEQARLALRASWAVLARIDEDGRLVAVAGSGSVPRGTVLAGSAAVADAGLSSATGPVRLTAGEDGVPADAVMIDPDRGEAGVLVAARSAVSGDALSQDDRVFLVQLARLLAGAFERIRLDQEIAANEQRLAEAQQLARLGSYDWHIPTDTNTWSDELYRIYGYEPGAFNASYERFLSLIHPDDRERIVAIHTKAMEDHQPYRMEERIVRPDGDVRILDSTGKVVLDEHGRPVRMVGICLDVTEQRRAAEALRRSQERFRDLVESAPDAVILFDADGTILQANRETERLFGWSAGDLIGVSVESLLPADVRRPSGLSLDLMGRHRNGTPVPVDVSLARIETDDGAATAAFVRDATARKLAEAAQQRLAQAEERRRQALEINDNVVQGLTGVVGALEMGWTQEAASAARATLASASAMMSELLGMGQRALEPGALVRGDAAPTMRESAMSVPPRPAAPVDRRAHEPGAPPLTVLLADDSADLRALYRLMLSRHGIAVVAEAGDGVEAVRQAVEHRPDIALVDLAMPGMDGLQVAEALRQQLPDCRVVMLSGFEESRVAEQARAAGVERYVAKGVDADTLAAALYEVGPPDRRGHHARGAVVPVPDPVDELLHELRTPLTVIAGIAATLDDRLDDTPPGEVHELLEAVSRNAEHMGNLVRAYADMQRLHSGRLPLAPEPVPLDALVRESVADMRRMLESHEVHYRVGEPVVARADPLRVRQILTNLLSNAAKFSPPGSRIEVEVASVDGMAELRVRDSGPGIPPERRPLLFRPFERLGAPGKGAGLGLYISRGLAEAHGGSLRLGEDTPDGLTTFVLRLPAAT